MHHSLTIQCLKIMQCSLRKNICYLPSDNTQRIEILTDSISLYLLPELQYSCRYWTQHLIQSKDPITEMDNAFLFLQEHFLHWVEVMSLLGIISDVVRVIKGLESIIQVS